MRKLNLVVMLLLPFFISCSAAKDETETPITTEWTLLWEDDFNGTKLDEAVWSRTERGKSDWNNTQSMREDLLEVKDGVLILKGIVNPNPVAADKLIGGKITVEADTAHYLTAGILSKGLHQFPAEGKIEVRARLQGCKGSWPAIWLMPYNSADGWPKGGEIDMMERLSFDGFVYQTIHTHYYDDLGNDNPKHYGTATINTSDFNIYGVEFQQNALVFSVNGINTFSYPRVDTDDAESKGQFPFLKPWYMLIDMQLGGSWVGAVDPSGLPIQMEIDWVRQYVKK